MIVAVLNRAILEHYLKISREREIKMILGERRSSPSTSVAQGLVRTREILLLRESSRKPLLMHMAHVGMFTKRSESYHLVYTAYQPSIDHACMCTMYILPSCHTPQIEYGKSNRQI